MMINIDEPISEIKFCSFFFSFSSHSEWDELNKIHANNSSNTKYQRNIFDY